jgi:amino acid transporter
VAEELAFARKASGLVRGLSMLDAFAVGFMNQGLTPSIWTTITLGMSVFLGANLIWATIISAVLAGIGFPLVWGILGGSMPRSGGEYIYNSRIIHPIVGIAQSFGDAAIWLMWIYVLAPLTIDPGLTSTFQFAGWAKGANWLESANWHTFLIASVINVIAFLFVVFGIKIFAICQKAVMFFGIGGATVIALVLSLRSHHVLVNNWNALALKYHSLSYTDFVHSVTTAAGTAMPTGTNFRATIGVMVAMSWLFAYAYSISFIAGEVKRPDKTIIWSNMFAIVVPMIFMLWTAIGLYHVVGQQFLAAGAWNDQNGPVAGYALPWSSHFFGLAAIAMGTSGWFVKLVNVIMGLSFVAFALWFVTLSYLAFPRILFAWGMDRMGPKWFTDVNPRFASPVKNHVLCFGLGEALILLNTFWFSNKMQNVTVSGLQITSVFAITALAAVLFPYMKRCRGIWDSSPYKKWSFLGLPVVVWGGLVNLFYLGILMYGFIGLKATDTLTKFGLILMVAVWVVGVGWYYYWKSRSKSVGVDVSMTYGELPPD